MTRTLFVILFLSFFSLYTEVANAQVWVGIGACGTSGFPACQNTNAGSGNCSDIGQPCTTPGELETAVGCSAPFTPYQYACQNCEGRNNGSGDEEWRCSHPSAGSWQVWNNNNDCCAVPNFGGGTCRGYDSRCGGGATPTGGSCVWALNETDDCAANPNVCQSPSCGSANIGDSCTSGSSCSTNTTGVGFGSLWNCDCGGGGGGGGGSGNQTRIVECRDSNGFTIPDSFCPGPRPPDTQVCGAGPTTPPPTTPPPSGCGWRDTGNDIGPAGSGCNGYNEEYLNLPTEDIACSGVEQDGRTGQLDWNVCDGVDGSQNFRCDCASGPSLAGTCQWEAYELDFRASALATLPPAVGGPFLSASSPPTPVCDNASSGNEARNYSFASHGGVNGYDEIFWRCECYGTPPPSPVTICGDSNPTPQFLPLGHTGCQPSLYASTNNCAGRNTCSAGIVGNAVAGTVCYLYSTTQFLISDGTNFGTMAACEAARSGMGNPPLSTCAAYAAVFRLYLGPTTATCPAP